MTGLRPRSVGGKRFSKLSGPYYTACSDIEDDSPHLMQACKVSLSPHVRATPMASCRVWAAYGVRLGEKQQGNTIGYLPASNEFGIQVVPPGNVQ